MRESLLAIGDDRFWLARDGEGPPLLMLHGGPGAYDEFDALAPMLSADASLIRFDQRGCGRTVAAPRWDLATALADIEAIRERLGITSWRILGHSFGCNLAAAYLLEHPRRVDGLVLIASYQLFGDERAAYRAERDRRLGPRLQRYQELGAALAVRWDEALAGELSLLQAEIDLHPGSPRTCAPRLRFPVNLAANSQLAQEAAELLSQASARERLAATGVAALVIHGDGDSRPGTAARSWAGRSGSRRFASVPGSGHWPWLEQPASTAAALRTWSAR